jgi:hypothetical protein
MLVTISSHAMKKAILFLLVVLTASTLIFFITGFIFYAPPETKPPYDAMTMHIGRVFGEGHPVIGDKGRGQFASSTSDLPRFRERVGTVRVATRYEGLLAQMGSLLKDTVRSPGVVEDRWDRFMGKEAGDPADAGMAPGFSLEATIRERMAMLEDVLEDASSQAGIAVDLLAAVAWAESKMLPYAFNVEGKAYYFTSREQALKALKRVETGDVDIGLFQVNYRLWGEPLGLKKEDLLNSRVCAIVGAMILKYNLQRYKDPWVAVGRYHSGDMDRIRAYQTKVSQGLMIIRQLSLISQRDEGSELAAVPQGRHKDPASLGTGRMDS